MLDYAVFYFFATLAVVSAILVVTLRNTVHCAIFLVTSLLATAGIFLSLSAEFLFVVQIILYAGGIMVLFVFVIMLVNLDVTLRQTQFARQKWAALALTAVLGVLAGAAIWHSRAPLVEFAPATAETLQPNTELIASTLFRTYMLPFEIASILLLVAMIGAVVMAKKRI